MTQKAFTLTELLVVVVIIGVLSAVVLPKFHQVIENRKVTEAEGIMTAVRSEQQARCLLDKGYTKDWKKLASLPSKTKKLEKNYTYTLTAQGIMAKSTNKNYTLRVLSYADGRICCEGKDCDSLNKDYPYCTSMGIVERADCAAEDVEAEDNPSSNECVDEKPAIRELCASGCGMKSRTVECDHTTGTWIPGEWDTQACDYTPKTEERSCSNGKKGSIVCEEECNQGSWEWVCEDQCEDACEADSALIQSCEEGSRSLNAVPGQWNNESCKCDCPNGSTWDGDAWKCLRKCEADSSRIQSCEDGNRSSNAVPGQWNNESCKCDCPNGSTWDENAQECLKNGCDNDSYLVKLCEEPPQVIIAYDNYDYPVYNHEKGTWNNTSCGCDCPFVNGKRLPLRDGMCTHECTAVAEQTQDECENGSYSDKQQGIAVTGHINPYTCSCDCPTNYGAKRRQDSSGRVTSCYRDNCSTRTSTLGWNVEKSDCELSRGFTPCGDWYMATSRYLKCTDRQRHYYKGTWNNEKCQCNCPIGTKLWHTYCVGTGKSSVDKDTYWGDSDFFDRDEPYDGIFEPGHWGDEDHEDDSWYPDEY